MNFSKYRKTLKLEYVDTLYIPLNKIKCQINVDFFKYWKRICGDSMEINSTPYYYYLKYRKIERYQDLMRAYGRSEKWIQRNIEKFFSLIKSISKKGFVGELPIVLEKPIIDNLYNKSYEIFEGHRRLSICLYNGIEQKVNLCRILNH